MEHSGSALPGQTDETKQYDFVGSQKLALFCILLLIGGICLLVYRSSLNVGFLLDDFAHLDYAYRAAHGDWSEIWRVFTGNWTGATDNLVSYRPFITLSFCLDYCLWHCNAFGYHLSNLLMFSACSMLSCMLMFELSSAIAKVPLRLAMGLLTGVLFAVYPLHPEAVAWIVGRVDVQCALFYFASLYSWLIFRRSGQNLQLIFSLLLFGCALPSKEMAVTLPAVVALSELILPAKEMGWKKFSAKKRFICAATFWVLLVAFAILRTIALGTVVGGYGGGSLKQFFKSLKNFLDVDTWKKVFYGVNEEVGIIEPFAKVASTAFASLGALTACRIFEKQSYWRVFAFLLLWAAIAELPTFQIWHVFPNLCGSRLLFLASAPFCMTLTMVALPLFNFPLPQRLRNIISRSAQVVGFISIGVVAYLWCHSLSRNLMPWSNAGAQMRTLTTQVRQFAASTQDKKVTLLLDLPQDLSGSGLLGRPEFLEKLLKPPLDSTDESSKLISAECPIAESHEFTYPEMTEKLLSSPSIDKIYKWDANEGHYSQWQRPSGESQFESKIDKTIDASKEDKTYWLEPIQLDPLKVRALELSLNQSQDASTVANRVQLVWRSAKQDKAWRDYSAGPSGQVVAGKIVFVPSRYRAWLYHGSITQVGLTVASGNKIDAATLRSCAVNTLQPNIQVQNKEPNAAAANSTSILHDIPALNVAPGTKLTLDFDTSTVAGAKHALLVIGKNGVAFPSMACPSSPQPRQILVQSNIEESRGSISLPLELTQKPGLYQLAVIATDDDNKALGFYSEPISIRVK